MQELIGRGVASDFLALGVCRFGLTHGLACGSVGLLDVAAAQPKVMQTTAR
jgi:hypothetical protein